MRPFLEFLARPKLLFYALPWLMAMLVLGTIAQRYIGLYQSGKIFFGSFIFWLGVVPLPGAYTTLGAITLSMLAKLILKSPLRKRNIGIIITHCSVVVLLAGGLVTSLTREEGYMALEHDQVSAQVSDYHQRELAVVKNGIAVFTSSTLKSGENFTSPSLPFDVRITSYCANCQLQENALTSIPGDSEDGNNRAGAVLEILGKRYIAFQGLAEQPEIIAGNDHYTLTLRQAERALPFAVRLIQFEKTEHPGTTTARSYSSAVEVSDGALKWKALIAMNEPLRYRGYTLYQSSFVEQEDKVTSVLAVVRNSGEIFPYLAIASLCLGLAVHLVTGFARRTA